MIAGFAVRLAGAYNTSNLVYVIASTVLIMSGPPVYALINYCMSMILALVKIFSTPSPNLTYPP
jgi:hypothetical protein